MAFTLTINDRKGVAGFAQGGIYREGVIYTASEDIPANAILRISPALWDKKHYSKKVEPNDYFWIFSWTAVAGEYTCLSNHDSKYRNVVVKVKVFNARIFEIKFEYLALADTGQYLFPYLYQPLTLWQSTSVDKSPNHVYNSGGESIGIRLSIYNDPAIDQSLLIDTEVSQSDNPVQGLSWQITTFQGFDSRGYMEVDGKYSNGYVIGKDLTMRLRNFPEFTNCQYFAGIYRVDKLLNQNLAFNYELAMQYAKANNTADEPFELTTNKISRAYLKDMHGFRYYQFESIADFTIDAAYFEAGAQYRLFLITKEECLYKSYLFDIFGAKSNWDSPLGDSEVTEITVDGEIIDTNIGNCLYNIPYGAEITVKVRLDIDTYNDDLTAKSITGEFDDFFKDVEGYFSDGVNELGVALTDQVITTQKITDATSTWHEITISFKIPEDWKGTTKYLNLAWIFEYTNGEVDHITDYILLNMANDDSIVLESPIEIGKEICENDAVDLEFCFASDNASADHLFNFDTYLEGEQMETEKVIQKLEDTFETDGNACLNFLYDNVKNREQYCINMRGFAPVRDTEDRPCDTITINSHTKIVDLFPGKTDGFTHLTFDYELTTWTDIEIESVTLQVFNINRAFLQSFVVLGKAKAVFPYLLSSLHKYFTTQLLISIQVKRKDGNLYYISQDLIPFKYDRYTDGATSSLIIDLCSEDPPIDINDNPMLSHSITWNYLAPPSYGSLASKTITGNFSNEGTPDSSTKYKIINGVESLYTGAFTTGAYNTVALRWVLEYDGIEIELYDCITFYEPSIP